MSCRFGILGVSELNNAMQLQQCKFLWINRTFYGRTVYLHLDSHRLGTYPVDRWMVYSVCLIRFGQGVRCSCCYTLRCKSAPNYYVVFGVCGLPNPGIVSFVTHSTSEATLQEVSKNQNCVRWSFTKFIIFAKVEKDPGKIGFFCVYHTRTTYKIPQCCIVEMLLK